MLFINFFHFILHFIKINTYCQFPHFFFYSRMTYFFFVKYLNVFREDFKILVLFQLQLNVCPLTLVLKTNPPFFIQVNAFLNWPQV